MHKPASMSPMDWFTKKTSVKTLTSESIVDAVIKHQWKSANEATKKNEEIEMAGIGKFYVSKAKVRRRVEKLEIIKRGFMKIIRESDNERLISATQTKLESVENRIKELKAKLNEDQY